MKRKHILGLAFAAVTVCAVSAFAQEAANDPDAPPVEEKKEEPSALKTLGSIGLAVVGFGVVLIPAVQTFSSNYSYAQSKLMLINLLRTNPNQAEQMAHQMKGTFCEAIAAALKIGGSTQSRDMAVIQSATKPSYDGVGQGLSAKHKAAIGKAKLGVGAALAGAGIGISGGSLIAIPIILAVLAAAAFVRLLLFKHQFDESMIKARAEVLPEAEAAIASGRYIAPPMPGM